MLAASAAAGVAWAFTAPIGGVLFSIEVTSTYYMVNNLWKAFFCSGCTILTLKLLGLVHPVSFFYRTQLIYLEFDWQYFAYAVLAVLCGILGSFMIIIINNLMFIRTKFKLPFISNRWMICIFVTLVVAVVTFPIEVMQPTDKSILRQMFSQQLLKDQENVLWNEPSTLVNLIIFLVIKILIVLFGLSLPIPAGISMPSLLIGAVFGRLFGYWLRIIFGATIHETTYALIGAAAVTSSVTRTLSVAMIIFEINGELTYLVPVLMGVIISYAISNSIIPSIFEILLDLKDLPYLPTVRHENYYLKAWHVMKRDFEYILYDSPISDLNGILTHEYRVIPVIKDNGVLLFTVEVQYLRKYIVKLYNSQTDRFSREVRNHLNNYFYYIDSITNKSAAKKDLLNDTGILKVINYKKSNYTPPLDYYSTPNSDLESRLNVREFEEKRMDDSSEYDWGSSDNEALEDFWSSKIDWNDKSIMIDTSPTIIWPDTVMEKIVFLFTMLNAHKIFVVKEGILFGTITKNELLKDRSQRMLINDLEEHLLASWDTSPANTSPNKRRKKGKNKRYKVEKRQKVFQHDELEKEQSKAEKRNKEQNKTNKVSKPELVKLDSRYTCKNAFKDLSDT